MPKILATYGKVSCVGFCTCERNISTNLGMSVQKTKKNRAFLFPKLQSDLHLEKVVT